MVARRPVAPSGAGEGGFTLIEMVIAAILGLFVLMVSLSILQVQSELQTRVSESVARQTVIDFAGSTVSDELRPVTGQGLQYADADSIAFRRPLTFGQFCGLVGSNSYLYMPLDGASVPTAQVGGIGIRDDAGVWTNYDMLWSQMGITMGPANAAPCFANGADTVKVSRDFGVIATQVPPGLVFSLYQVRNLSIATSQLNSADLGLFVGGTSETTREMVSGLTVGSKFEYRHQDGRILIAPTSAELRNIKAVRFTAVSSATPRPGAHRETWTIEVRLQNAS
jgi:type II secretory pathway pseudopilin PulG